MCESKTVLSPNSRIRFETHSVTHSGIHSEIIYKTLLQLMDGWTTRARRPSGCGNSPCSHRFLHTLGASGFARRIHRYVASSYENVVVRPARQDMPRHLLENQLSMRFMMIFIISVIEPGYGTQKIIMEPYKCRSQRSGFIAEGQQL